MVRLEESSDNDTSVNLSKNDESVNEDGALDASIDPYYPPIVSLPEVDVPTGEDNEEEIFKIRSKLFRFDANESPPEWKERGTGEENLSIIIRPWQQNEIPAILDSIEQRLLYHLNFALIQQESFIFLWFYMYFYVPICSLRPVA